MLYDEPTTGLDPITATTITDLIVKVRDLDGVTSILVTHQLRDAFNVARTFIIRTRTASTSRTWSRTCRSLEGTEFMMLREGEWSSRARPTSCRRLGRPVHPRVPVLSVGTPQAACMLVRQT